MSSPKALVSIDIHADHGTGADHGPESENTADRVTKEILNMLKAILTQSGHLIGKRQPLEAGVCRESVSFSVQSGSVDSRYSISLVLHLSPDCPMSQDCSEDYKGPRTPL